MMRENEREKREWLAGTPVKHFRKLENERAFAVLKHISHFSFFMLFGNWIWLPNFIHQISTLQQFFFRTEMGIHLMQNSGSN